MSIWDRWLQSSSLAQQLFGKKTPTSTPTTGAITDPVSSAAATAYAKTGPGNYGMQVFGAAGQLQFSTTDVTWNQVDMVYVKGGTSFAKQYQVLTGKEVLLAQFMVNPPPIDRRAIAHNLSVSGTTVTVSGGSEDTYVVVLMR